MAIPNVKSFSTNSRNPKAINPVNLFGNLSQTNYYQVNFSGFSSLKALGEHIKGFAGGVDLKFAESDMGLLCSEATLPGSSLATAEVKDNFMGISQEYAHTRLYTDIDFTFYIDKNFNTLKFFEGWIDFIASGSEMNTAEGLLTGYYYRRMHYPDDYKCSTMSITKFEKDFEIGGSRMHYLFINAFPKLVTAVPVSYGGADILRVSVSFNYDRYIVNPPSGQYERQKLHDFKLNRNAETNMRELQKNPAPNPVNTGGNTNGITQPQPPAPPAAPAAATQASNTGPKNYGIGVNQKMLFVARNGKVYEAYRTDTGFDYYLKSANNGAERVFGEKVDTSNNRNSWLAQDLEQSADSGLLRSGYWDARSAAKEKK